MRRDGGLPMPEVPPGAGAAEKTAMLAIAASHPLWMVERWLQRYGEADTLKLLVANNRCPACLGWQCLSKQTSAVHIPGSAMRTSVRAPAHLHACDGNHTGPLPGLAG